MKAKSSRRRVSKRAARNKYTAAEREAAVADVAKLTLTVAAAKHGIPISTLCNWTKALLAKQRPPAPEAGAKDLAQTAAGSVSPSEAKGRPAKSYTPSQRAQILERAAQDGVSAAAEAFGVSRFSIYHERPGLLGPGVAARPGDSRRVAPAPGPGAEPGEEPTRRDKGIKVSVHTVRRVTTASYPSPARASKVEGRARRKSLVRSED